MIEFYLLFAMLVGGALVADAVCRTDSGLELQVGGVVFVAGLCLLVVFGRLLG